MKKIILKIMLIGAWVALHTAPAGAQEHVAYPYKNYMNWPMLDSSQTGYYMESVTPSELRIGTVLPFKGSAGQPFNFSLTGTPETCTIYGMGISLHPYGYPSITSDSLLHIIQTYSPISMTLKVFQATEGEATLRPIITQKIHIDQGKRPDKILDFPDANYPEDPIYWQKWQPIYEFYFDHPLTITGTFIATAYAEPEYYRVANFDREVGNLCLVGYSCWLYPDLEYVYSWEIIGRGCTSRETPIDYDYLEDYADPLPIPDVRDSIATKYGQWLYPILVPYGTTAVGETRAEASAVRLTPNPAHGQVEVQSPHGIRAVELTDMAGRTLLRQRCDDQPQSLTLDISALPQGIYTVKVETPQTTATEKLAVQ